MYPTLCRFLDMYPTTNRVMYASFVHKIHLDASSYTFMTSYACRSLSYTPPDTLSTTPLAFPRPTRRHHYNLLAHRGPCFFMMYMYMLLTLPSATLHIFDYHDAVWPLACASCTPPRASEKLDTLIQLPIPWQFRIDKTIVD